MSVLTLPRINFFGKTEWNPDTSNNYDSLYDSATAEPNFKDTGTTPQTYLQYLKEHSAGMGNWNVYGDQATTFVDTKVSSVALQGGKSDPEDPLMNRPIQILGLAWSDNQAPPARLVDVDPYSSTTSQLFFDSFQIGDDEVGVIGKRLQRFSDREFFFARNLNLDNKVQIAGGMGVTWQTAFHKDELTWNGVELSTALSVLKAAVDATGSNGGMVVRFANYRTDYFTNCSYKGQSITDFAQLQAAYLDGFEGFNPAYSIVIGSVGVWQEGESITGPNDRVLIPNDTVPLVPTPTGVEQAAASAVVTPSAIPLARIGHKTLFPEDLAAAAAAAAARQVAVGPAQAKVTFNTDGSDTVVFDFVNTFPETTQELTKANLGSFLLQVQDPNDATQVITIGKKPLTYDDYKKDPYEANAGIYTFSFDPGHANAITSGLLQLVSEADPSKVILLEQEVVASTVLKNFYLDEHQVVEVDLQVADKGSTAATVGTFVAIAQYNANGVLITNAANRLVELLDEAGQPLPISSDATVSVPVGAGGKAGFKVRPLQAGNSTLTYLPTATGNVVPPDNQDTGQSFSSIRNLPFDADLAPYDRDDYALTWPFVYENVLMVYDLVYPLMSLVLNLHNKNRVDAAAVQIRAATAEDIFNSTLYMPITRELSALKRRILWRYFQQLESGVPSPPPAV